MPNKPNPERYGETWLQYRIDWALEAIDALKPLVVLSGGFAWHFMSPEDHIEYKHAHDHKDVDIYIPKANIGMVMGMLPTLGFEKVRTKHDNADFRRYEQVIEDGEHPPFRITLDLFDGDVESVETPSGWKVVKPDLLLTFYKTHHSSVYCWAVQAAKILLDKGEIPENLVGRRELLACPERDIFFCTKCGWSSQFPEHFGFTSHKIPKCGGCGNYVPLNIGKPTYKTMNQCEAEIVRLRKEIK
jgi:hypothetical protein